MGGLILKLKLQYFIISIFHNVGHVVTALFATDCFMCTIVHNQNHQAFFFSEPKWKKREDGLRKTIACTNGTIKL